MVSAPERGTATVFNSSGSLVMTYTIVDGDSQLLAPSTPGIYLIKVRLDNGTQRTTKLVVVSQ